jgi:RNA polymerase sigma-70 factor, ECF subfamily
MNLLLMLDHSMFEEQEEISLMRRVSSGDEEAFRKIYDATCRKVFQYLYRLTKDHNLAEDIASATYLEVWKSAKSFRGDSKVLTWMMGIARNLAMNEFRKGRWREQELDENIVDPPEQFHICASAEVTHILGEALDRLPVIHREILDLVFLQGMNYEEISRLTDIPVNTVKTRVFYGKDKLRTMLSLMGVTKDDIA